MSTIAAMSSSEAIRAGAKTMVSPTARITKSSSKKAQSSVCVPRKPGEPSMGERSMPAARPMVLLSMICGEP